VCVCTCVRVYVCICLPLGCVSSIVVDTKDCQPMYDEVCVYVRVCVFMCAFVCP
jgi:hypothetical protein